MRKIILAMLSLTMLIGPAMSTDPLEERSKGVKFNYEDSISGFGNFASNNKFVAQGPHADARVYSRLQQICCCSHADARVYNKLADVYLQKMNHGSGSIESGSIITSTESTKNQTDPDMIYAYALIAILGNSSMLYKPQVMSIGNGYYATHPVNFDSLLSDRIQIKNYASETSMTQETKQARAINMNLVASVEDDYSYWDSSKSLTRTFMNLEGSVTSGAAHIGMLQGNIDAQDFGKSAWHNPNIDVEEDYTGSFNLATKMNFTLPVTKTVSEDSWLPCCSGGWEDMKYSEKKDFGTDAKGVFDCTCPKGLVKEG